MTRVDVHTAERHFAELIKRIEAGEEIILEKDQKPIARLSPIDSARQVRKFGSAKGMITIADDFDAPLDDFAEYS